MGDRHDTTTGRPALPAIGAGVALVVGALLFKNALDDASE